MADGRNLRLAIRRSLSLCLRDDTVTMNRVKQAGWKVASRRAIRILLVIGALWGGWLAAGALNDRRNDVPRPLAPASQPSAPTPKR